MDIKARAKINLSLEVLSKFENGYHDLLTIMQSIDIYDKIRITTNGSKKVTLKSNIITLETDTNIAIQAAKLFYENLNLSEGCHIDLTKNIPMEAGMAGGSTDAAAVLIGLNQIYGIPFNDEELTELGQELGADVPFCLSGGTKLAKGIGNQLIELPYLDLLLLIVKPKAGVSTKELFSMIDSSDYTSGEHTMKAVEAIRKYEKQKLFDNMRNGLYKKSYILVPEMQKIIKQMEEEFGAQKAMMSGSGSTVFGIFNTVNEQKRAYEYFKSYYEDVYKTKTARESISVYD